MSQRTPAVRISQSSPETGLFQQLSARKLRCQRFDLRSRHRQCEGYHFAVTNGSFRFLHWGKSDKVLGHLFAVVVRPMRQLDGLGVKLAHLVDGQSPRCAKTIRYWILVTSTSFDSVSHFDAASRSARSTIKTSAVSYTITCSDKKKKHISLILDMSCRVSEDWKKYIDITNWPWSRVRSSSPELWLDIA